MLVLSLSGPLVPGVVLIICPLVLLSLTLKNLRNCPNRLRLAVILDGVKGIDKDILFLFVIFMSFSIYSLYIGSHNALNFADPIDLWTRYLRIPFGLFTLITTKLALPILLVFIGVNLFLLRKKFGGAEGDKIFAMAKWIGIFSILYILLLPLGGFRVYRPNIVRYDTMLPITISLFFLYALSTSFIIKQYHGRHRVFYLSFVILFLLIFANADGLKTDGYICERLALETIAQSKASVVVLPDDCPVLEFRIVRDPEHSVLKADLLHRWNVTKTPKLFYQDTFSQ